MKFIVKMLETLIVLGSLAFVIWLIAALYATFHEAQGATPAVVKVIGIPSSVHMEQYDVYMRFHRCWYTELCE